MGVRITSWNVNGIRNPFGYQPWRESRTYQAMFDILEADIVVMQETKIQRKDLRDDMVLVPGWDVFFSLPRHKKGYSGVAVYTRNSVCCPIKAEEGITGVLCPPNSSTSFRDLPKEQQIGGYIRPGQLTSGIDQTVLDSEGRCIILEFPAFVLIGVYCPANRDESRTDFRLAFIDALDIRVRNLVAEGKSVVVAGDLNIIRSEMDFANPMESLRKDGMTVDDFISMPARRVFNQLIFEGRVIGERDEGREKPILWDLCRAFHPQRQNMFTCWDTKKNARPGNYGSRIDYILCTDDIKPWLTDANIQEGLLGSDHCPVFAVLGDRVVKNGKEVDIRDLLNPPALFKDGKRLREWSQADLLPLSAKLIPEFDRRQSIRDMFSKNAAPKSKGPVHETEKNAAGETGAPEKSDESTKSTASSACPGPTPEPPAQTSGSKRPIAATAAATRPPKKSKGTAGKEAPAKPTPDPSQKTLAGFFKPAAATESPDKATAAPKGTPNDPKGVPRPGSSDVLPVLNHHKEPATPTKDTIPSSSKTESPEKVFDPIESKESWSKLLKKRVVPRCEHGEPCISLVTKKPGVNQGRSFFICPRPLGPSGEKERGTEWRCGTFIWSSEWKREKDPEP